MTVEETTTRARQGERNRSMLWVLLISTSVAVVLAIGAYFYVYVEDDENLDQPIPQATTAPEATTPGGS